MSIGLAFSQIALLLLTTMVSVGPLGAQATFRIAQIYSNLGHHVSPISL